MNESERAIMEAARFVAMEAYFDARPQVLVTAKLERIFEAGFNAGYAEVAKMRENAKVIGELEQLATRSNNDLLVEAERLRAELAARECRDCKRAWEASPVAWYRPTSDGGYEGPLMDSDDRMCTTRRKVWQPLYTRPFQPDWVNYRQGFHDGVNDARSELKQLCSDFSDLRDRPYMGDVHAQIDAVTEQMLKQMPLPPEPKL